MPRMHGVEPLSGRFVYHDWWHVWRHGAYSLVLTKAAFLHRDFLRYYAGDLEDQVEKTYAAAASSMTLMTLRVA